MAGPEPEVAEEADHPPLSRGEAAEVTGEEVVNVEAVKGVPDTRPHPQRPVATGITDTELQLGTVCPQPPAHGRTRSLPNHEGQADLEKVKKQKFLITTRCFPV